MINYIRKTLTKTTPKRLKEHGKKTSPEKIEMLKKIRKLVKKT